MITCGRCGKPTTEHGNRPQDGPLECGWTQAMVLNHYGRYGPNLAAVSGTDRGDDT